MALGEQIKLVTLQKRGQASCVNVSNKVRALLGWNVGDPLRIDVVDGSLVVTKVILQPRNVLRKSDESAPVVSGVQSTSDNGE